MKRFSIFLSKLRNSKIFVIILIILVMSASFFATKGFGLLKNTEKQLPVGPSSLISTAENEAKLAAAPTSGPLQYTEVTTYYAPNSKSPKFVYFTPEYVDERIIEMNDKIIKKLNDDNKVNDNTDSYSISYFDDKKIAEVYFDKISDKLTSANDQTNLRKSYSATYVYSKQIGFSYIIKIGSAKIIKNYLEK